ncbi:MAG: hypothetical protein ACI9SY_000127 [Candidatus Paceibacteria bacterium]|jgi:hypothetical protein
MPNILTNPFIWVTLFAVVFLGVMVSFLAYVFRFAAQRNQPERETLQRQGPLQPTSTSTLQKMAKVIFNWKTIIAVGLVVLVAYLTSNYLSIIPDWQTVTGAVTGGFSWAVEFVKNYGIWLLVAVPLYLAAVGYNQNKMNRSYTGDALYYVLGGAAVIGGIALVVLGKNLLLGAVAQSRDKTRATFECWYMETTTVDCDAVSQIAAPSIDWGVLILCLFGFAFLGGLWKMKFIQQTTAVGATIIVLPFMLWLAWGALPDDYKSAISETAASVPFVKTEAERQVESDIATAGVILAAAVLEEQQRLREAALREANRVKFIDEVDAIFTGAVSDGSISDVEVVQLRLGGDRHYRDGDSTWQVAAYPRGQVVFEPVDANGNGIPEGFWVRSIVPLATVTLVNGIKGQTFRQVTF